MIFAKKTILLVSEENRIVSEVQDALDPAGFSLQIAEDAESGIEMALNCRPYVILLDLSDPLEVISTLKPQAGLSSIPMFVVTEGDSISGASTADDYFADDFICSTFDENTLGETIKLKVGKYYKERKNKKRFKKISVLIIDDEEHFRRIVKFNLHREGFKIYSAPDGISGMKLAKKHKPSVILLDVKMPGMDGFEVLTQLRYQKELKNIPVFMLTAKSTMEDVEKAFDRGAVDYITKPLECHELADMIRTKLDRRVKV